MKKHIIFILFITLCYSIAFSYDGKQAEPIKTDGVIDSERYRSYPFQWIFPEYYYKADIISVKKEKLPPQGFTKIGFFGLSAYVPLKYTEEISRKHDIMRFKSKAGDTIIISKSHDSAYLCSEETRMYKKDYCLSFNTVQELFHKQFTLTPDLIKTDGDAWIVHSKGKAFENFKKIKIYSSDRFISYVNIVKDQLSKEARFSHIITLFHENGPMNSHITITFLDKDDTILNHFISTIE